jgi:hypothetical protein
MWGGGYKMATQAILPSPQVADSGPEVACLGQTCKPVCNGMFQSRGWTMWQSRVHARVWCKWTTSLLIPQRRIFARNLFNKIDAEASYLAYTYLFPGSWEIKYVPYIVNMHYISCGGGGEPPQSASLHSRGNIFVESCDQARTKADHSSTQWTVIPLLFSRRKYCCT